MTYKKFYPNFKLKAVTFSFDDGTVQDIEMLNILNMFNLKATFNLNSALMNKSGDFIINEWLLNKRLEKENITYYKGHEIASHSSTHTDFKDQSDEALKYQIDDDIKELSKIANEQVVGFAYPYGIYSDKVIKRLKKNKIVYARSVNCVHNFNLPKDYYTYGGTCTISDADFEKLINRFVKLKPSNLKLFYIWGHAYEMDCYHEHEKIYNLFEKLANKDDIYYATNKDVFMYIKAFKKLHFDKTLNKFVNNSNYDLYIEYEGNKMIIPKKG